MSHKEILQKAIDLVNSKILIDGEVLDPEEVFELQQLRYQMNQWLMTEQHKTYIEQLEALLNKMEEAVPGSNEFESRKEEDEAWEAFNKKDFTVTFDGVTATLYNGAQVYSDIQCMLKQEIDEWKGGLQ